MFAIGQVIGLGTPGVSTGPSLLPSQLCASVTDRTLTASMFETGLGSEGNSAATSDCWGGVQGHGLESLSARATCCAVGRPLGCLGLWRTLVFLVGLGSRSLCCAVFEFLSRTDGRHSVRVGFNSSSYSCCHYISVPANRGKQKTEVVVVSRENHMKFQLFTGENVYITSDNFLCKQK